MVTRRQIRPPRYLRLRELWNAFDPLGIFDLCPDWADDEYDRYLGDTMDLLDAGDAEGLLSFVRGTCRVIMGCMDDRRSCGIERSVIDHEAFVRMLQAWHDGEGEREQFVSVRAGGADRPEAVVLAFCTVAYTVPPPTRLPRVPRGSGGTPGRARAVRYGRLRRPGRWDLDDGFGAGLDD